MAQKVPFRRPTAPLLPPSDVIFDSASICLNLRSVRLQNVMFRQLFRTFKKCLLKNAFLREMLLLGEHYLLLGKDYLAGGLIRGFLFRGPDHATTSGKMVNK